MMFCWLHILTVLFWFMKVLWGVMAAATTLSYPNEIIGKQQTTSFESTTIKTQKDFEDITSFRGTLNSNSEFNNNPISEVEFHSGSLKSENTTDFGSNNVNGGMITSEMKKEADTKECDKVCEDRKRSILSEDVAIVRFPLKASLNDDVLSGEVHEKEFILRERDISSTYQLDNYNPKPDNNNTTTDSVRFKTVKGVNNDNSDYVSSLSTSADDLLSAVPPTKKDKNENVSSSISNNKTVAVINSDVMKNTSSYNVRVDKTIVTSKPSTDSFTTNSDKFSKGYAGNVKPTVKMNKNRTLQELKPGIQIKYSEESKKKVVVKTINDNSDNISLQMEVTQVDEDSSVLLMNDEPANVSDQNKNRGLVHVPNDDDDSLEFSPHDIGNFSTGVNASVLETNETFSTAAHGHTMKTNNESSFIIAVISGVVIGVLIISSVIGGISYILYRRRYWNKPHTLSDKCSNADSSGYIDDSTLRDNSEEMYSLDNDSFLNSLEAMTIQNYWTDNVKHTKL